MFIGYNLKIRDQMSYTYTTTGNNQYKNMNNTVRQEIKRFINDDGSINATIMKDEWFPAVNCDIFISHSSKDRQTAIMLAGWLKDTFGLNSFIDSCVCSYCDDLLQLIDKKYCYKASGYYDYTKRNYSTSHVHNMLSTALNTMIDKCECIIFLNTINSIKEEDAFKITESPWIYNELSTIKTIRRRVPEYLVNRTKIQKRGDSIFYENKDTFPQFKYNVDLDNLTIIDFEHLKNWEKNYNGGVYPLIDLYLSTGALKNM